MPSVSERTKHGLKRSNCRKAMLGINSRHMCSEKP